MFLIRNIKVSVKVKPLVLNNAVLRLKHKGIKTNLFSNFITFKAKNFTFVLFKSGQKKENHINITQIPNFRSINKAIASLVKLLRCRVLRHTVDNIIATSALDRTISLRHIVHSKAFKKIKYNSEIFPGLFVKFWNGTVIIFHTGKLVIVGCKNKRSIKWILQKITANI
jgi:TATA-box binding protein (TBP) (component of TFIID and TFIIIB)